MTTNAEMIRNNYDAFARGDINIVLAALDPKIEWTEAAGFPYAGTYTGPDAVLTGVFARLGSEWDGFEAVPDHIVVDEETVVAIGTYSGTFKATGRSLRAGCRHSHGARGTPVAASSNPATGRPAGRFPAAPARKPNRLRTPTTAASRVGCKIAGVPRTDPATREPQIEQI